MHRFSRIFFYVLIFIMLLTGNAFAAPQIIFNGNTLNSDVQPIVEQGVTLVPFRVVLENFGASVDYQDKTKKITVSKSNLNIALEVGKKTATVNGTEYTLLVAPKIYSSRTLVPLRFISEALNAQVDWNNTTKTVTISYSATAPNAEAPRISDYEQKILDLVNATRKENGLKELVWVNELADLARSHSEDMAKNDFFDHTSPTSGTTKDRAKKVGLPAIGENIAAGPMTPEEVHEAWMNSPGHRANVLDPDYRFIGIGVFMSSDASAKYGGKYFTQDFIAGDTFLTMPKDNITVENTTLKVTGYSIVKSPKIKVYKMIDDKNYSDSYEVTLNAANGKFSQDIQLKFGKGKYLIWATDQDARYITLK